MIFVRSCTFVSRFSVLLSFWFVIYGKYFPFFSGVAYHFGKGIVGHTWAGSFFRVFRQYALCESLREGCSVGDQSHRNHLLETKYLLLETKVTGIIHRRLTVFCCPTLHQLRPFLTHMLNPLKSCRFPFSVFSCSESKKFRKRDNKSQNKIYNDVRSQ